jgi:hypothetical protein
MTVSANNLYGRDGFFWWIGVVENRNDPALLGRCQVRIFGYHTDNTDLLPTADLPWAIPMQPITSAAMSGVGTTPLGAMPGSWVMGFFADGKDCQQPIIMGTFAGFKLPTEACSANQTLEKLFANDIRKDENGNPVLDSRGEPVKIVQSTSNTVTAVPTNNTGPVFAVVGDSIALGVGGSLARLSGGAGVSQLATVGAFSGGVLASVQKSPNIQNARFAIISVGTNDIQGGRGNIEQLKSNSEKLRTALAAKAYLWILPYDRAARAAILSVALKNGDQTLDLIDFATKDNIHPVDYNAVARSIRGSLSIAGQGSTLPTGYTGNNNFSTGVVPGSFILRDLPPLSKSDVQVLMNSIGYAESGSVPGGTQGHGIKNSLNFIGKYQFGAQVLTGQGYLNWARTSTGKQVSYSENAMANNVSGVWKGKDGISSTEAFLRNKDLQERLMFDLLERNWKQLSKNGIINPNQDPRVAAGLLHAAHLSGAGGAQQWAVGGKNPSDAYGATPEMAYAISYAALNTGGKNLYNAQNYNRGQLAYTKPQGITIAARAPNNGRQVPPNANVAGPLNDPKIGNEKGFNDPASIYPTCDYANHPDTNKLATGQDLTTTILNEKIARTIVYEKAQTNQIGTLGGGVAGNAGRLVGTAIDAYLGMQETEEISTQFNAEYPFNKVMQTEGGHVIEFDDTPGRERIHLYHKSGTYFEIGAGGNMVQKVEGFHQEIASKGKDLAVMGNYDIYASGNGTIKVKGNYVIEAESDAYITVKGGANLSVSGDMNVSVGGNYNLRASNIIMEATFSGVPGTAPTQASLLPGNITMLAANNIKTTAIKSHDCYVGLNHNTTVVGTKQTLSFGFLDLKSISLVSVDGSQVYFNTGLAGTPATTVALPTGLLPPTPSLTQVVAGILQSGVDELDAWWNKPGGLSTGASTTGADPSVSDFTKKTNDDVLGAIGVRSSADVANDASRSAAGYGFSDISVPGVRSGTVVQSAEFTGMKIIPESARLSKNTTLGMFTSKAVLKGLTTAFAVALTPAGDRNLGFKERLGLGLLFAGSNAILQQAGISNTQKIIGTLGQNLAVVRLRGEQGYPLGYGLTVLARTLPTLVDIGLDTYKANNPNLTQSQKRNLGYIGVGAAAVSATVSNPNAGGRTFAQNLGLTILGAGYTFAVQSGQLTSNTQQAVAMISVKLLSNEIKGDRAANERLVRGIGGAALGYVVSNVVTSSINARLGSTTSAGARIVGDLFGVVVKNAIQGQRTDIRRLVGYAAGTYVNDVVYSSILSQYGTDSAQLAAQAGGLAGRTVSGIVDGSLSSDLGGSVNGRRQGVGGIRTNSTGSAGKKLTGPQIATNLKALAVNCIDPIIDRYPDTRILVGYREDDPGQLGTGQAVEIDFPKRPNTEYYDIARWIKDNLAFDQLLLQTETIQGKERFWIRVSFNADGNRPAAGVYTPGGRGPKVATMIGQKLYRPYLVQVATAGTIGA